MSAAELKSFLADLKKKLATLSSQEALETRVWAEQRLELLSDAKAAEFRKAMPDVANMTVLQVEQALEDIKQRRAADVASHKNFERFRDQEVAALRARQQAEAQAKAAAAAAATNVARSSPHPGLQGGSYAPRTFQRFPGVGAGYGWGGWRW
jgi:hypothetical protein